jgi:hypothetical protein
VPFGIDRECMNPVLGCLSGDLNSNEIAGRHGGVSIEG